MAARFLGPPPRDERGMEALNDSQADRAENDGEGL